MGWNKNLQLNFKEIEMNQKYIIAGLFLLFIILSGIWLSRTGRPLSVLVLTLHKLVSLGAVVFLAITVYRIHQAAPLSPLLLGISVLTLLLFITLFATGGLLSTAKTMPAVVLKIHQITPFLVVLSTSTTLYLLVFHHK
jgi:hypothetical protein